jgi:RNA polymerase sigma-70 factor (ECF subfamily)
MTGRDDLDLVRECLAGNRPAFEELVERYQGPVFNVAYRITGGRDDAEDVAQSVFLKAYESLRSFDARFKFFSWLYRIAVNEALNVARRRERFEPLGDDHAAAEAGEIEADRDRILEHGIAELPPDERAVITLRHFQGLSYDEMAEVLGIPANRVKSRLYSARTRLRGVLTKKGLTSDD